MKPGLLALPLVLAACDYPGTWQDAEGTHWVQIHAEWELERIPTTAAWDVPPTVRVDLIMDPDDGRESITADGRCHLYGGTYRWYPKTRQGMCEGIRLP